MIFAGFASSPCPAYVAGIDQSVVAGEDVLLNSPPQNWAPPKVGAGTLTFFDTNPGFLAIGESPGSTAGAVSVIINPFKNSPNRLTWKVLVIASSRRRQPVAPIRTRATNTARRNARRRHDGQQPPLPAF